MSYTQTGTQPSSNGQFCTNEHNGCYEAQYFGEKSCRNLYTRTSLFSCGKCDWLACKYIWKNFIFFFILRENVLHEKFSPSKLFSEKIRAQIN